MAIRNKPEINKVASDDSGGCIWLPFQIIISLIFVRVLSGYGTIQEKYLSVGIVLAYLFWLYRNQIKENQAKEKWRSTCSVTWLAVLDRHSRSGGSNEDEYGIAHSRRSSYYLELEMNADQRAVAPNDKVVRVDIGGSLYNRLLGRETLCIYYQPDKPLSFFIAEEF